MSNLKRSMVLPYFYIASFDPSQPELVLSEENSRHIVQVLRMQRGDKLQLTDGVGGLLTTMLMDDHKKRATVRIQSIARQTPPIRNVTVAISLLKNASRLEWFLEKATEIGVRSVIPLLCERTERQHFRQDRLQNILVSAMLQSQQTWLPVMPSPISLPELLENPGHDQLFIAHCLEEKRATLGDWTNSGSGPFTPGPSQLILIGPEGDFSPKEIELAMQHHFVPVTLGATRLRTETAGVVAAALLCLGQYK